MSEAIPLVPSGDSNSGPIIFMKKIFNQVPDEKNSTQENESSANNVKRMIIEDNRVIACLPSVSTIIDRTDIQTQNKEKETSSIYLAKNYEMLCKIEKQTLNNSYPRQILFKHVENLEELHNELRKENNNLNLKSFTGKIILNNLKVLFFYDYNEHNPYPYHGIMSNDGNNTILVVPHKK